MRLFKTKRDEIEKKLSDMIVEKVKEVDSSYVDGENTENREKKILNLRFTKVKEDGDDVEYDLEVQTKTIFKHYEPVKDRLYVNGVRGKEKEIEVWEWEYGESKHLRNWGYVNINAIIKELMRTTEKHDSDIMLSKPKTLDEALQEIQSLKLILIAALRSSQYIT